MVEKGKVVRKIRMDEWACERVNERERERSRQCNLSHINLYVARSSGLLLKNVYSGVKKGAR